MRDLKIVLNVIPYFKGKNFLLGGYEFNSITVLKPKSRILEFSMTNDPEKVWPGGIVHYAMDTSLGMF